MLKESVYKELFMSIVMVGISIYWGLKIHQSSTNSVLIILLGIASIIVYVTGLYLFHRAFTRMLLPEDDIFDELDFSSENSKQVKKLLGSKAFTKNGLLSVLAVTILFVGSSIIFFNLKDGYDDDEFEKNGIIQKVKIYYKSRGKSTTYVHFTYKLNGTTYEGKLANKEYKDFRKYEVGDSVIVIFSKVNPYIIKWAD